MSYKIFLAITGLTGACILFFLTTFNSIGLSPDSAYYISVARHIIDGKGFIGYDGYNFILQPPLYPAILALINGIFYLDPIISAGYVNAFLFGTLIVFSGLFLLKYLKSFPLVILGTVAITVAPVLIKLYLIALSEPLFILLVLLYLYFFDIYREKGAIKYLLLFSIAASLACLTRYAGIIIVLTGFCGIIIWGRKSFKQLFSHLSIFIFISALPAGLWVLRNYFISGTFTGSRAESSYTFTDNLTYFFDTVIKWFLPVHIAWNNLLLLFFMISAAACCVLYLVKVHNRINLRLQKTGHVLLFLIFYSGTIIVSSTTTAYDKIADRLLSPIFIPLIFITFIILDNILAQLIKLAYHRIIYFLFLTVIITWLAYPLMDTLNTIKYYIDQSGWELSGSQWRNNSVIKYLNDNTILDHDSSIYSNAPDAVYILANKETKWSPAKTFYNSPQIINPKPRFNNRYSEGKKVYLIWFNNIHRNFLFSATELRKYVHMKRIARLKDGSIYTVPNR